MSSPLDNLAASGSLHREAPDTAEYAGLLHSGTVRLADSRLDRTQIRPAPS